MTGRLRILIADDELMARRRLTRLLGALPDVDVVAECSRGDEVPRAVRAHAPDVLLLDIDMPGLTGLEATQLLAPEHKAAVIFCTAHAQHAVDAFDEGAADYLLKPIEAARLQKALARARERMAHPAGPKVSDVHFEKTLALTTRHGVVLVPYDTVTHAAHDGQLVTVHAGGRTHVTDMTLQDLAQRLPPAHFYRVHRRAIVNLAHLTRLDALATGGYRAHLGEGQTVEVSRSAARALRRALGLTRPLDGGGDDDVDPPA
jgi:two-component system LytT family response regulator